jgi:hypothetical protein
MRDVCTSAKLPRWTKKKWIHTSNPSILDETKIHSKLDRSLFSSQMKKSTKLKKSFSKVSEIWLENDINWLWLVKVFVWTNDFDVDMLKELSLSILTPNVLKVVLKEWLLKTKSYRIYDKKNNVAYVTDRWKDVWFTYTWTTRDEMFNWMLRELKKEWTEIKFN